MLWSIATRPYQASSRCKAAWRYIGCRAELGSVCASPESVRHPYFSENKRVSMLHRTRMCRLCRCVRKKYPDPLAQPAISWSRKGNIVWVKWLVGDRSRAIVDVSNGSLFCRGSQRQILLNGFYIKHLSPDIKIEILGFITRDEGEVSDYPIIL